MLDHGSHGKDRLRSCLVPGKYKTINLMEQGYTKNSKDVISLTIEGDNYLNQLKINQNLTINNLRATIENELKRKVTIAFGN